MELDTPNTLRARQLRDVYNIINMKHMTQDERLDALLTLKQTVKVNCLIIRLLNNQDQGQLSLPSLQGR